MHNPESLFYITVKFSYVYLLVLSIFCFTKSMKLGMSMDSTKIILNPFLYVLHLTIWWLSAVQIYQCISLLMNPLTAGWWVPLICKHGSLIAYVVFLNFISFRHQADILEITKLEKLCNQHYEGKKVSELVS